MKIIMMQLIKKFAETGSLVGPNKKALTQGQRYTRLPNDLNARFVTHSLTSGPVETHCGTEFEANCIFISRGCS